MSNTSVSTKKTKAKIKKQPWPKTLSEQAAAVQTALVAIGAPADEVDVAKRFTRASKDRIAELLETLASLGSWPTASFWRFSLSVWSYSHGLHGLHG